MATASTVLLPTPLLTVRGVSKGFPGVQALDDVHLEVNRGEVHALLGENGAGKSTLLKVLAGAHAADAGELRFEGRVLDPRDTPQRRNQLGIATIYQEFNLFPALTVAENLYVGREPRRGGFVDWRRMHVDARRVVEALEIDLDPRAILGTLGIASQQLVEIAKAMTLDARLIVMDEPTAALSGREVDRLMALIRPLRARGVGIVYVSHRLEEVKALCDRYTVFRDGRTVAEGRVDQVTIHTLVRQMVGREVRTLRRAGTAPPPQATPVLAVRDLRRTPQTPPVSLEVHAGEIVGVAGLVGAGRTEFARALFGADPIHTGHIEIDGRPVEIRSPREALAAGIALVPEDRKQQGCFLMHSIRHNLTLPSLRRLPGRWFVDEAAEAALVAEFHERLSIRMPNDRVAIGTLSGGNQQKVLLARYMALQPRLLIVDEPTRGIDVGAKADVHQVLFDLAAQGVALIVISSELPEVMAVSDRIVTFRHGAITADLDARGVTEETLMRHMTLATPAVTSLTA